MSIGKIYYFKLGFSNVYYYICFMKKCNKCLEIKDFTEFGKESRSKNGYKPRCKKCSNEYYNKTYINFRENKLKTAKTYYKNNKEYIKALSENHKINIENKINYNKKYYLENKEKLKISKNEYEKNRIKNDYNYRLIKNIRKLVYRTIKNKNKSTFDLLGYSKNDLIIALGKCPDKGEAIDHKIPVSWFIENTDIKLINHLNNLQILTIHDNSVKSNKFSHEINYNYYQLIKNNIKEKYLNKINYGK